MGDYPWLLNLLDKMGVPVVALVAIGYAIWKTGKWMGINILMPLQARHLLFLDRLEEGIQKIIDKQVDHTGQMMDLTHKISNLNKED